MADDSRRLSITFDAEELDTGEIWVVVHQPCSEPVEVVGKSRWSRPDLGPCPSIKRDGHIVVYESKPADGATRVDSCDSQLFRTPDRTRRLIAFASARTTRPARRKSSGFAGAGSPRRRPSSGLLRGVESDELSRDREHRLVPLDLCIANLAGRAPKALNPPADPR